MPCKHRFKKKPQGRLRNHKLARRRSQRGKAMSARAIKRRKTRKV